MRYLSGVFFSFSWVTSLFLGVHAFASYPTVWTIENHSRMRISIECKSPTHGLPAPMVFRMSTIEISATRSYAWEGWHNDGMGLNPGNWTCAISNAGESVGIGRFQTSWGENIQIEIKDGEAGLEIFKK